MYGLFTRIKSFHSKNSYDAHKKQVFRSLFKYLKTLKETSPRTNAPEPVQIPVPESVPELETPLMQITMLYVRFFQIQYTDFTSC